MISSGLAKMNVVLHRIRMDFDQSHVDHHWRASTLESCGDLMIARSLSSCWYMTSDLFLLYIIMLFDCNHQGVSRPFGFR